MNSNSNAKPDISDLPISSLGPRCPPKLTFAPSTGNIAFSVNGTTVYNAGSAGGSFNWTSAGASQGYTNGSGIVYDVYVT